MQLRKWPRKKGGGHLQHYRGCTNTIIERAKNFNHAKSVYYLLHFCGQKELLKKITE